MNTLRFDSSLTIVSIISLSAIISPVIVALINNIFNLKNKKLEFKHKEFIEIFKNFTFQYHSLSTSEHYLTASKFQMVSMQLAVICKDIGTRNDLLKLGNLVTKYRCRTKETDKLYEQCVKQLFNEV